MTIQLHVLNSMEACAAYLHLSRRHAHRVICEMESAGLLVLRAFTGKGPRAHGLKLTISQLRAVEDYINAYRVSSDFNKKLTKTPHHSYSGN